MKETQQQVQSIQNILVGENVLVFLFDCSWQLWEEKLLSGLPRLEHCLRPSSEWAPPGF